MEDVLQKNNLLSRIVTVGLDKPYLFFETNKGKVIERYIPGALGNHQNYSSNLSTTAVPVQERLDRADGTSSRGQRIENYNNVNQSNQAIAP